MSKTGGRRPPDALRLALPSKGPAGHTLPVPAPCGLSDHRARGGELRVATKYANLTREFLYRHGINYFTIVSSQGALEAAPTMGYGDIVSDLMTSGVTLRENRLKTITGGTILGSEACLI